MNAAQAHPLRQENGIALLTVLLIMVMMAVLGIAAIAVTGVENRIAGFSRTGEASAMAAESCLGTGVNIILETIDAGNLPAAFIDPAGPVPQASGVLLNQEIMGQADNNGDTAEGSPNLEMAVNGFRVRGDIDRLYARPRSGGALQFAAGYEGTAGGATGGGVDLLYRIDCVARNTATNTVSRVTAVYACAATGDGCQRQL